MKHEHTIQPKSLDSKNTSSVQIQISHRDAKDLIPLLASRQIPFQVVYQSEQDEIDHNNGIMPINTSENFFFDPIKKYQEKIENIYTKYIQNFPEQLAPTEETIASSLGMTANRFRSIFKTLYGKSFYQLYLEKRMEYAKKLLCEGFNCNEVSKAIGYGKNSAIKFNKMFQKYFGMTPKRYQIEHNNQLPL